MTRRTKIIGSVIIGGAIVAAAASAIGWFVYVPQKVASLVREAGQARLGLPVEPGSVDVGWGRTVLKSVRVGAEDDPVRVTVGEVAVEGSAVSLALSGSSAIESVETSGVHVFVDLRDPRAPELVRGWRERLDARGASGGGEASSSPSATRSLALTDTSVEVVDEHGSLVNGESGAISVGPDTVDLTFQTLTLGSAPGDEATLTEPHVIFHRAGAVLLDSFELGAGTVTWAEFNTTEPSEPAAGEREGEQETHDPNAERRLRARLIAAKTLFSSEVAEVEPEEPGDAPSWTRYLTPDASIELNELDVLVRTNAEPAPMLTGFSGQFDREGAAKFKAVGEGQAGGGGPLSWDVTVDLNEVRGAGHVRFERLPLRFIAPLLPDLPLHRTDLTTLSGDVNIAEASPTQIAVRGSVSISRLGVSHRRLASRPINDIALGLEGAATWNPTNRRLDVSELKVKSGRAEARVNGSVEWPDDHYFIDARAILPATDCNDALRGIPRDLRGPTSRFSWRGELGGNIEVRVDSRRLDDAVLEFSVADGCRFVTAPPLADLTRFDGPFEHSVLEPDGSFFEMTTGPRTGNWTSINAVSGFLVQAVLSHEDAAFFRHSGFAPWAIRDALVRNLKRGRYATGASTITMQLAKNLFLHREKTLARKVQEVLLTWWLESRLPKERILELYLNVIEYGPGIYGIRNAARHYFGRKPDELSPAEAVFLAAILPNPKGFHSQYERGSLGSSFANKMRRQIRHLASRGRFTGGALNHGLQEISNFRFHRGGGDAPDRTIYGGIGRLPISLPLPSRGNGPATSSADGAPLGEGGSDPWAAVPTVDPGGAW